MTQPANDAPASTPTDDLPAFLKSSPSTPDWHTIYKDIPFKTDAEVSAQAKSCA